MAYRFVLDVPEAVHEDAEIAITAVRGAEILISRHSRAVNPDRPTAEITVVAHTLDVIDALYAWANALEVQSDVYLDAFKGERLSLSAYDPATMRRIIQGDQYWFENTVPRISHVDDIEMEGGALVSDVPFGGRVANATALVPAETQLKLDGVDHIALRVRDMARAERFYQSFFGMDVIYRAYEEEGHWVFLDADFDWEVSIHTGVRPEIVRLENGPVALVLINVGIGRVLHEDRVSYVSVRAPIETLDDIRGRALFSSFTVLEDTPFSFRFVDPFGMVWQIVSGSEG
jgi:catechol 2,3-dioxygenase-like lactoylglutathione lyase family enzyme